MYQFRCIKILIYKLYNVKNFIKKYKINVTLTIKINDILILKNMIKTVNNLFSIYNKTVKIFCLYI